jgi:hypothetical protein
MKVPPEYTALILEDITKGYPGLTDTRGHDLLEACIITLYRSKHKSGIELQITGIEENCKYLIWAKSYTSQIDRTWKDQNNATKLAAECISLLLAFKYTGFTVIESSVIGSGIDYWLGNETNDPDIFEDKARLEVSGIFDDDDTEINRRVKEKIEQTKQSANTLLPAYISIIEFSRPKSKFVIEQ